MPANRELWKPSFPQDMVPGLPCPRCTPGKLKAIPGSLNVDEPKFSTLAQQHDDWEPEWSEKRFALRLKCDETTCGEVVSLAGNTEMVPFYHDEPGYKGWGYIDHLQPHAVFPAPPLFRPPVDTPSDVQQQLQLAFQLYWVDLAASIGRLRTAVEQMLDDQNIPRDKGSASGKTTRMDLASRIDVFAATANGSDSKDALDALRHIGNLGTHGTAVSDEAFFDAVDVLEDVLLGVYDKKSIKAKITKLNSSKGKY